MRISTTLSLLLPLLGNHLADSFAPINAAQGRLQHSGPKQGAAQHFRPDPVALVTRHEITRLNMAMGTAEPKQGPPINVKLIAQSLGNQALIGSTILTGGAGYEILTNQANFGITGLLLGLVGLAPLLYVSNKVETSESPLVAGLNLSTNMSVLRIFGSKPQPVLAFLVSILLGGVTGVVEEVTFRGQILPRLADWSTITLGADPGSTAILYGAALSTLIFALLHTNPTGFFKGGEQTIDNIILLCFQLATGSIFAALYLATGNLAVPIVAHALYDFITFYKTHLDVAGQMEYATQERLVPVGRNAVESKWKVERDNQFVQSARETFYLMDTNQDGILSRKELRVALFSYGINLSKMESSMVAKVADLDKSGSIDFDEFLEFVGPAGSTNKAVKNALLGPA
jgi:membrane protease YdiL (CAAX protease family)